LWLDEGKLQKPLIKKKKLNTKHSDG